MGICPLYSGLYPQLLALSRCSTHVNKCINESVALPSLSLSDVSEFQNSHKMITISGFSLSELKLYLHLSVFLTFHTFVSSLPGTCLMRFHLYVQFRLGNAVRMFDCSFSFSERRVPTGIVSLSLPTAFPTFKGPGRVSQALWHSLIGTGHRQIVLF